MEKEPNDQKQPTAFGFGERLRAARKKANLTQTDLGRMAGEHGKDANKQSISDWEAERYYPKIDQLRVMCLRTGASADDLIFGDVKELAAIAQAENAFKQLTPQARASLLSKMEAMYATASESPSKKTMKRDVERALKKNKNAPETREIADKTFVDDQGPPDFLPK